MRSLNLDILLHKIMENLVDLFFLIMKFMLDGAFDQKENYQLTALYDFFSSSLLLFQNHF